MKHGLPLPVQVSSLSGKQQQQSTTEQSVVSTNPFPADQSNGGKCFNSNNPFVQDTFKESGPVSLDTRQDAANIACHRRNVSDTQTYQSLPHNKDNPFISGQSKEKPRGSQNDVTKKVGGWNPFEDTVNFGAVTEDYLFGAEFDKMRAPSGENSGNAAAPQTRKDPFGSAPFSAQEKQC